ncbi:MAG: amino acid adenylation domain-containing protein, partial [Thermoanaerobaculia bacterium]
MFEAQARRTPDAPAVSGEGTVLTYAALDAEATRIARQIRELGGRRGSLVAVCAGRTPAAIAGLLATWKVGAAYLPLDPHAPEQRIAWLVRDAGASLALVDAANAHRTPPDLPVLFLDAPKAGPGAERKESPSARTKADDIACVLYTSGTTGEPKGVEVLHRGILRLIVGAKYARFDPSRVFLHVAPLSFDASTFEIWGPLLHGGQCILFPDPLPAPRRLGEVIRREAVNTLWLTSSLFNAVIDEEPEALRPIRQLLIGGEALSLAHVRKALERLPDTEIINGYGPTETTTFAATYRIPRDLPPRLQSVPIGRPISRTEIHLLDRNWEPVSPGHPGEVFIGGEGLARGYRRRPDLTAERFVPDPFSGRPGARLYRTGDRAKRRTDGELVYLGRFDRQVKLRGHRIEPEEVEAALARHPGIRSAAVALEGEGSDRRLAAWIVPRSAPPDRAELRDWLAESLPAYMIPSEFRFTEALARTPAGKIDRGALAAITSAPPERAEPRRAAIGRHEALIASVWKEVLGRPAVGLEENFFDLGGNSLHLITVHARLCRALDLDLPVVRLFEHPTVASLAAYLDDPSRPQPALPAPVRKRTAERDGIAVIGMAGRFPGAPDVDRLWDNLLNGVDSISRFTDGQLRAAGADESLLAREGYVRARGVLEGVDLFDAAFFGIPPREAELTDPQHRIFLECAHEALERAACDPQRYRGSIGVFAGLSLNTYLLANLNAEPGFVQDLVEAYPSGAGAATMGNDKDFLPTRVSYKLNLTGPSLTVASACSTSLTAVALACQSLWAGECDVALAGGVSVSFPQVRGYLHTEGGMVSPDGRCRPFDAAGAGTVFGAGAGVVVLKRLKDAVADGDSIAAVIRGAAMNNDGSGKVGYAAPSVGAQASVIARAHAMAGVSPREITYVEGHGTGTPLGDPIEVAALTRAFRDGTSDAGFCALGSVKGNVGHLEAASGVTGLIKTVLALQHGVIPGTMHFEAPNPKLQLDGSPFFVSRASRPWITEGPRRAGVSSFGVGGTNVHLVLEQAPEPPPSGPSRPTQLLTLSARSAAALEAATAALLAALRRSPAVDLADVTHTLRTGRKAFPHRRIVVCDGLPAALQGLEAREGKHVAGGIAPPSSPGVVFLFPGQGTQFVGMGRALYESEADFRQRLDECAEVLTPLLGVDPRRILFPVPEERVAATARLEETALAQPILFSLEYSLAALWMSWGIRPAAMIGHSVGEYVAACVSGVMAPADALALLVERGRMMEALPPGGMLAVRLSSDALQPRLSPELSLSAVNASEQSVVSGPLAAIASLEERLAAEGIASRRLRSTRAFHSAMLDPMLSDFERVVSKVRLSAPRIPYVSNVSGAWIDAEEVRRSSYWSRHIRSTVRFADGLDEILRSPDRVLLEIGPGQTLSSLVRQRPGGKPDRILPPPGRGHDANLDHPCVIETLGRLWLAGVEVDWDAFTRGERRRRVPLPTYPFERKSFWVEPAARALRAASAVDTSARIEAPVVPVAASAIPAPVAAPERPAAPDPAAAALAVQRQLAETLSELSGIPAEQLDPRATFLELGLDSLFLTQASQAFSRKFDLRISFRELLEDHATLEALAGHVARMRPALPVPPPPAPRPDAAPVAGDDPLAARLAALERLVAERLGGAPAPPAAAAPPGEKPQPRTEATRSFSAFGPYKPIEKAASAGLTPKQERYLAEFTARYTARTAESKRLTQENRARFADPRAAAGFRQQWKELVYPIVATRSAGCRLWDVDGNEYVDLLNGFGLNLFGHSPEFVTEAVRAQLDLGVEIGPQSPDALRVATAISEMAGVERVTFCNTGSEAVMAALRLARTVTGRKKIALFAGSYHGTFDEVLVRGIRRGETNASMPIAPGIPEEKVANVLVLEYGSDEALRVLQAQAGDLAALLVEPVQSRHPDLQPREFLHAVRAITEKSGTALIFDEVITGFRVHPGGAQAWFGVRADLVTYGKVVGGGMPIGVLAGRPEFMDALDGGFWSYGDGSFPETGVTFFAGTFVRHPIAMAAAEAVLGHLRAEGPALQERLNEKAARFTEALNDLFARQSLPVHVQRFGSILYLAFPSELKLAGLFHYHLRAKGVHILEGFPCFLTTAHTEADLRLVLRAFEETISEMQEAGFLPEPRLSVAAAGSAALRVPLTEAQKEVFLAAQMGPEASCAFNESVTVTFRGDLDRDILRAAFRELVARHDALRARFDPSGDHQVIDPQAPLEMSFLDLSEETEEARTERLSKLLDEEARTPFDLRTAPLLRARLVKVGEGSHQLLLTAHHLVCDGWSTNVLLEEAAELYSSGIRRQEPPLEPAASFAEYAAQEREDQDAASRSESYWLGRFSTLPSPLELPLDRPRPPVKSDRGATERRLLDPALTRAVRTAGAREGATLFATLLAAFEVLLHRLTGQRDLVVGVPAAGQSRTGAEDLVGHCVNFLPVRAAVSPRSSFRNHLRETRARILEAYENQAFTYGSLVRRLALPRDPSRLPIVEVQFNLEKLSGGSRWQGLSVTADANPKAFVNFDLFFNVVETDAGLVLDCDYNAELFEAETVRRWLAHFETLLAAAAGNPDEKIAALPLVAGAERLRLVQGGEAQSEYPRETPVHRLIEARAERSPDRVAAVYGDSEVTYRELNERANRVARHLMRLGAGPGQTVAVCIPRSIEMLVGLLAALKSGAAYLPIDPDHPAPRKRFILRDASAGYVLTLHESAEDIPAGVREVALDADAIARESSVDPAVPIFPESLAYVIYTSGSTGGPKGVEVPHRALANLLHAIGRQTGFTERDSVLAVTTVSFDIAALEWMLPLVCGGCVVLAGRQAAADGARLRDLLKSSGATYLQATPATWQLLIAAGWEGTPGLTMLCGGEALPRPLANALASRPGRLWNMYGPTETTIWSAAGPAQAGEGPVPLPGPIANTGLYVLDASLEPAPPGVAGELFIGGEGLARGYRGQP